jgi:hypothetical protein
MEKDSEEQDEDFEDSEESEEKSDELEDIIEDVQRTAVSVTPIDIPDATLKPVVIQQNKLPVEENLEQSLEDVSVTNKDEKKYQLATENIKYVKEDSVGEIYKIIENRDLVISSSAWIGRDDFRFASSPMRETGFRRAPELQETENENYIAPPTAGVFRRDEFLREKNTENFRRYREKR